VGLFGSVQLLQTGTALPLLDCHPGPPDAGLWHAPRATTARKRAGFGNCLRYAAELGLLEANPLDRISWRPPKPACLASPRSLPGSAQVQEILAEVTRLRPELAAFFGWLYHAALRPAEAVALRVGDCDLPPAGWGRLTLTGSLPRTARAWTSTRRSHEPRGLKHRPEGTMRMIPIPPDSCRYCARLTVETSAQSGLSGWVAGLNRWRTHGLSSRTISLGSLWRYSPATC
jgi:hypothetical protein